MTKKLAEQSLAEKRKFRGKLGPREWSKMNQDANYEYRWVCTTPGYMKTVDAYERAEGFIDKGWTVVWSEDRPIDERSNKPDNTKENSDRQKPVTKRLADGHTYMLMRCNKEQRKENELAKAELDDKRHQASVKKVNKQGNNITIEQHDIDLSSNETNEE